MGWRVYTMAGCSTRCYRWTHLCWGHQARMEGHPLRGSWGQSGFVPVHPQVALGHGARLECTLGFPLRVPEGLVVLRGPGAECTLAAVGRWPVSPGEVGVAFLGKLHLPALTTPSTPDSLWDALPLLMRGCLQTNTPQLTHTPLNTHTPKPIHPQSTHTP